jgi:putative oxygen-independent coproporphyrinogen III oxidase
LSAAASELPGASAAMTARMRPPTPSWAVYVHFPYCIHRCAYCDFATVAATVIPRERTLRATLAELETRTATLRPAPIGSVFFGGGTPSLWGADAIGAVLDRLERWSPIADDAEITLEANPGAAEAGDLERTIDAGVNRISLGVQALDDARLRALDRVHDAGAAHQTLALLRALLDRGRLRSASADLIYGAPGQDLALLSYELPHLSAYALTVEPDTPLAKMVARGVAAAPDDDLQATMLAALPGWLAPAGLTRYEVSNFARAGHESRHNLVYWQGGHYLALGVGAHGFLPGGAHGLGTRYGNTRAIGAWTQAALAGAAEGPLGEALREEITAAAHLDELLLTGLRLRVGLSLATVRARLGSAVADALAQTARALAGRVAVADDHVRVVEGAVAGLDGIVVAMADGAERALRRRQRSPSGGRAV